jgi:alpha-glucosidase
MERPPYLDSIHHDGSGRYVKTENGGEPCLGETVTIRLRSGLDAPVERVFIRTSPDGEQQFTEMNRKIGLACDWWEAHLKLTMPVVHYRLLLLTGDGAWWLNGRGLRRSLPTDSEDFRILTEYSPPAWVRDSVFYQIFPDRFCDGDRENNVKDGEFTYWGLPSRARKWGEPLSNGHGATVEFFGGDLAGIESRLDYLQELGVNALYLNPIFPAYSNHRYDVIDYDNVDPHLGGNEALVSLRRAASERKMHFILDIVPNHCGFFHPWFQQALEDPSSPTSEFFTFQRRPDQYESWLGVKSLPKFNYRSQKLREEMYAGKESIMRRWLKPPFTADGWRLDVANMLARQGPDQMGREVGRGIRKAVREENPEAYILGENFFDSSDQLQGDCWDATMNYMGFAKPLWYWLTSFRLHQHSEPKRIEKSQPWPTDALIDSWRAYLAAIPWIIARQQYNLLGSHDTDRILKVLGGRDDLNRLAAGILMTYPGVPGVYYGDEVGMGRGKLEASRACMPWDKNDWDEDLLAHYKQLVKLRRSSPALINGGFQVLYSEENSFAYLRDSEEEILIVVANRGPGETSRKELDLSAAAVPDGVQFREIIYGAGENAETGRLSLPPTPPGIQIWKAKF